MKLGRFGETLFVLLIFVVFALFIFWPIFFGKVNLNGNLLTSFYPIFGQNLPYKNIIGLDQLRLSYPNYSFIIDQFKSFYFPHWNPYYFAGGLDFASLQGAALYPLNIFIFLLGKNEFWHFIRISPLILGSLLTFIYLRNLKLSLYASFFGAISFGFSPLMVAWGEEKANIPHTIIWLPLILYCIDKIFDDKLGLFSNRIFLALISLSIAFSILAGFAQISIYVVLFVIFYTIFKTYKKRKLQIFQIIYAFAAIIFGVILSAIQFLPVLELYLNSARSVVKLNETLINFLLPKKSLITYLAPDFFGNPANWNFFRDGLATYFESILFVGIGVLIFALYEVIENSKDRLSKFFLITALIVLSLTLNLPTSRLFLSLPIPFISSSIANRLLFIPTFCLVILGAKGMDLWLKSRDKKIFRYIFVLGVVYGVVVLYLMGVRYFDFPYLNGIFAKYGTFNISIRNLIVPMSVFAFTSIFIVMASLKPLAHKKSYFAVLIILVAYVHVFLFSQKYLSFTSKGNVFPTIPVVNYIQTHQGYYRSWGIGDAYLENNFGSQYKLYYPDGYNSLNILSYAEFMLLLQNGTIENFTQRADAGLGRGNAQDLLQKSNSRKIMDFLGVKYLLAEKSDFDLLLSKNFVKVFEGNEDVNGRTFGVFENQTVLPRVLLASNYEGPPGVDSTNKTEKKIKEERRQLIPAKLFSEGFDWRNVIILEEPSPISPQFGPGTADIVSYKPNEVVIKTKSDQPKLLFLTDNYYPGWKAKVDGEETKILRADYTFRAVPLRAGEHTVRFYFDSDSFKWGLIISVVSLVALALFTLRKNRLTD